MKNYMIWCISLLTIFSLGNQIQFKYTESKPAKMIYFIRHAESKYNILEAQIKNKFGEEYMKTEQYQTAKFSKQFLDVEITEKGVGQCLQAKEKMKDIHVDLVIVSPLRRALRTCELIFEDHSSCPPVIVHPDFREILCSSNDIGSKVLQSKKQYSRYDFSLITEPDFWYLQNIQDEEIKHRLLAQLNATKYDSKMQAAIDITLQFLREHFVARQADPHNEDLVRKVLPSLKKQVAVLLELLEKHKSIAVVSHSQNIKAYVGYKIQNCEIYEFSEERLRQLQTK